MRTTIIAAALLLAAPLAFASSLDKVRQLATEDLAALGREPVIVAAVKEQNALSRSLSEIKEMDTRWQSTAGVADFMRALIDSPAGRHLGEWKRTRPFVSEVFVMDNQGANVAQTDKTSDYWQGDEPKFTECVRTGRIHLGPMDFDESTQTYSIQVSVPVKDGDALIGAICIGVDVEQIN